MEANATYEKKVLSCERTYCQDRELLFKANPAYCTELRKEKAKYLRQLITKAASAQLREELVKKHMTQQLRKMSLTLLKSALV